MKHFMQPRNTILREIHSPSASPSIAASNTNSMKQIRSTPARRQIFSKENTPPDSSSSPSISGKPLSVAVTGKMKNPLPPRPPNPHKRKLLEITPEQMVSGSDSGVQVIVRMRPPNKDEGESEVTVKKISRDSLSINGQTFTFDSVADTESTQSDIFQLVGFPLVENCLAGFNSSVFAYGQTGSGKTYTIWGPANELLEENLLSDEQGLTPRVFNKLFSRIKEEQIKHANKQYLCRCSFLEIYNEQITDLLDPSPKSLHIREDVKSGVYVENLTEECVCTMKDVTQLLIKGLSHRRIGATSINAESSRSHSVFTCVVESRYKSSADGVSSFRTSRINLVDLAGSERQKLTGAAGDRLKEAGNINKSLSQLGNLINILAEVSQTGKQRHIPYRDSRLTFLLQDSLGGNAKLAMVCAISPFQSCKSETLSTLRFAQRAKAIKNKAVVNEVMQDDVNVLREVIKGLKDELLRMKANGTPTESNEGYSTGWNARRSLNLLRFSLHRPMTLPHVDDDGDIEMEIITETNEEQPNLSQSSNQKDLNEKIINHNDDQGKTTIGMIDEHLGEERKLKTTTSDSKFSSIESSVKLPLATVGEICTDIIAIDESNYSSPEPVYCAASSNPNLSIVPCEVLVSPIKSPIQSVSPKSDRIRKSLKTSSTQTASSTDLKEEGEHDPDEVYIQSMNIQTSKNNVHARTEQLTASLHRGLEIMDNHRQSTALRRSSYRSPLKNTDFRPKFVEEKVNVGVQTLPQDNEILEDGILVNLCSNCKSRTPVVEDVREEVNDGSNLQLVPVNGLEPDSKCRMKKQVPKVVEKVLAGAIRREMALEEFCSKQAAEIMQLNRLVQQYKHERECNAIIGQTREDKIVRLEALMDGVLPTDEFMEEEFLSLRNEHKILKDKYENHPEILRTKVELKRVQDELESYKNFHDMGERDVLIEEIHDLRSQLQYYVDSSSTMSVKKQGNLLAITNSSEPNSADKFEQERLNWIESEKKWISLAEELRAELESSRLKIKKQNQQLDSEKKCGEELKEAMQMAMEGHARMLEQYAELQENHFALLTRHRKFQEGIDDVKKAALKAGVKGGAESRFINALASEISALKVQMEKESRHFRDENKVLQAQLRDTAEAVQAAGELLVRLKEAEEAVAVAQNRAMEAEKEVEKAYKLAEPSWFNGYDACNI